MSSIITAAIFALLMPLVLKLQKKVAPVPTGSVFRIFDALQRDYQRWYSLSVVATLFSIVAITASLLFLFVSISSWRSSTLASAQFVYTVPWILFLIPALFLGLFVATFAMLLLYRRLLGDRYEEFMYYCDVKSGYNSRKHLPMFTWIAVVLSLLILIPSLNSHIVFTENAVLYNRFFSLTETAYGYDRITEIAHVKKHRALAGNVLDEPHYLITFDDGIRWATRDVLGVGTDQYHRETIEYLFKKTGLSLVEYEFAP